MGYCDEGCEYLTRRHNCNKYHKGLTYFSYDSKSLAYSSHERCTECDKDHIIADLEAQLNQSWIPVSERLPAPEYSKAVKERGSNAVVPVLATVRKKNEFTDNDEYSVVDRAFFGNIDKECTFFDLSATKIDVVAWMPLPEPYRP